MTQREPTTPEIQGLSFIDLPTTTGLNFIRDGYFLCVDRDGKLLAVRFAPNFSTADDDTPELRLSRALEAAQGAANAAARPGAGPLAADIAARNFRTLDAEIRSQAKKAAEVPPAPVNREPGAWIMSAIERMSEERKHCHSLEDRGTTSESERMEDTYPCTSSLNKLYCSQLSPPARITASTRSRVTFWPATWIARIVRTAKSWANLSFVSRSACLTRSLKNFVSIHSPPKAPPCRESRKRGKP